MQAQVEKEDDDFDPDNAEADEGEPIGADEADDAGESLVCVSCESCSGLAARIQQRNASVTASLTNDSIPALCSFAIAM